MTKLEIRRIVRQQQPIHSLAVAANGQLIAIGHETGLTITNAVGAPIWDSNESRAFAEATISVTASRDFENVYACSRTGNVFKITISRDEESKEYLVSVPQEPILNIKNDIFTSDSFAETLIIGHLSAGFSILDTDGKVVHQRHAKNGNATDNHTWSVGILNSGDIAIGSADYSANVVAVLNGQTGNINSGKKLSGPKVTHLTVADKNKIVAIFDDENAYLTELMCLSATTETLFALELEDSVTALAADKSKGLVALAIGHGDVAIHNVNNMGKRVTSEPLRQTISCLAIANDQYVVAGSRLGNLFIMEYQSGDVRL